MTPRDVELVRARLAAIARAATRLGEQAEDLFLVAHERAQGDEAKVRGGDGPAGLDTVGDPRARALWRRLFEGLPTVEIAIVGLDQMVGNLLSEGPSPAEMRGTLITPGDHARALRRQDARRAGGEYVPHRTEEQPKYPGGKS